MLKKKWLLIIVVTCILSNIFIILPMGCAVDIPLIGGPKDSIPPVLVAQSFYDSALYFKEHRIGFLFDKNVNVKDAQKVIVNPFSSTNKPEIRFNMRKMWMFWEKPLDSNATYTIDFKNSLTDFREGNIYSPFVVVFSTGDHIDTTSFSGKVIEAKTGKPDSTVTALLFDNLDDSAVIKLAPRYIAKVNNKGFFNFQNIAKGKYKIFALADPSGTYQYLSPTQSFAFLDTVINIQQSGGLDTITDILYTFNTPKSTKETKQRVHKNDSLFITHPTQKISLLDTGITLVFNKPIRDIDTTCVFFSLDSGKYRITNYTYCFDSTLTRFSFIYNKWYIDTSYQIIIQQGAVLDTFLRRNIIDDTIRLLSYGKKDYSSVKIDINKSTDSLTDAVLFIMQNDNVIRKFPITQNKYTIDTMIVGDYTIQILYDENHNLKWDNGEYLPDKRQPEKTILLPDKFSIKHYEPDEEGKIKENIWTIKW